MSRIHKHLIVDALIGAELPNDNIQRRVFIEDFIPHILEEIDMHIAEVEGNPIIWYCADEGNKGWTINCTITTSHMAIHFWEDTKEMHFDLYSCKDYDEEKVLRELDSWFKLVDVRRRSVTDRSIT